MGSFGNWLVAAVVAGLLLAGVLITLSKVDAVAEVVDRPAANGTYPVEIALPRQSDPRVMLDAEGSGAIPCSTCHVGRQPVVGISSGADLDEFHQGLHTQHGDRTCLSCHNGDDYDTLRLADGTAIRFSDSIQLCAQCHGPQFRDYTHGAHGGMNGYWDLTRGPRQRNTCTNCHDPHAPQFPVVHPAAGPRDRFAPSSSNSSPSSGEPHHDD